MELENNKINWKVKLGFAIYSVSYLALVIVIIVSIPHQSGSSMGNGDLIYNSMLGAMIINNLSLFLIGFSVSRDQLKVLLKTLLTYSILNILLGIFCHQMLGIYGASDMPILFGILTLILSFSPLYIKYDSYSWSNYIQNKMVRIILSVIAFLPFLFIGIVLVQYLLGIPVAIRLIRYILVLLVLNSIIWNIKHKKEIKKRKLAEEKIKIQNLELQHQKYEVEEAHKEITDSINYAERIQRSFLATDDLLNENLNEYFVYFNPKEAVSGDFYWAGKLENGNFALVNADSTGHGVPGAIMSILNISSIEKAVDQKVTSPAEIFNETRTTIIQRLKNDGSQEGGKDGMDASLIAFNSDKTKMQYVAAQNPIWIIRDGKLTEIKPEKMPVGRHHNDKVDFVGGEYDIQKGDLIYTLTDGFQDQFGGQKGKKFMIKKMREYVLSISNLPMNEQQQKISDTFSNWKGELEQIDDVCVIGVRI